MRRLIQFFSLLVVVVPAAAAGPRFVIDDDAFADKVAEVSAKLLHANKLRSLTALRREVQTKGCAVALAAVSHQELSPPDLCDRLRESTLAVGTYYKCPDCGGWHFNSSAGFVVAAEGIVCTCCHVLVAEDPDVTEAYLVAADSEGRVFPVRSVVAADTESDTCFLKLDSPALKPLPISTGARTGEKVYCLSHPGGYFFMFTEGMVARLNLRRNDVLDERGKTNGLLTRPILFLNVTTEFAPGSSGAPLVDQAGNVVAQVASIAEAGEPSENSPTNAPPAPSVPVRFCTASEEILRLAQPDSSVRATPPKARKPKTVVRHQEVGEKK
jgi:S1-C subfamily serine protease